MTDIAALRVEAAKARAAAMGSQRTALPMGEAKREDVKFHTEFRSPELVQRDGQDFYLVEGYASVTETPYEMWDLFGPYEEVVARSAFDATLAADPMVVFRFNHGGTPMANTRNGRLELSVDVLGLHDRAWLNPKRADVVEMVTAITDRDVAEQSFMFMINDGEWNEDATQFRINVVDLDRGDVGPVTYGANPSTMVAARSGQFLDAIPSMPVLAAREAMVRLAGRRDLVPSLVRALDPEDTNMLTQAMAWFTAVDSIVDEAQEALADYLQVPSPDPDDMGYTDQAANSTTTGMSVRLALAQLEVDKQYS